MMGPGFQNANEGLQEIELGNLTLGEEDYVKIHDSVHAYYDGRYGRSSDARC